MTDFSDFGMDGPDEQPESDAELRDKISSLVKELENSSRKVGLYLEGAGLGVSPNVDPRVLSTLDGVKSVVKSQDGEVVISATFTIGDVAWSKRVQDPDQHEVDKQVRTMLPDPVEEMRERLKKAREEGKNIFDIDPLA